MENDLAGLSGQLAGLVRQAGARAVAVDARHRFSSSGIIWQAGVVVTADHAIKREDDIKVTLPDGKVVPATLAGRDPGTDLAVLKVEGAVTPPAEPAPEAVEPGALVLAVGRSTTTGVNAAMGVVSAVSGPWRTWRGGRMDGYIRLDVGLYAGLSGAAVVDIGGRTLGMATSALSRLAGVAVPGATIGRVAGELLARGRVARPYLGVGLQPVHIPPHLSKKAGFEGSGGLIVLSLEPDGPAERAGMLVGDILAQVEGKPVEDTGDVQAVLDGRQPGDAVAVLLLRGGVRHEAAVTLGDYPRRAD